MYVKVVERGADEHFNRGHMKGGFENEYIPFGISRIYRQGFSNSYLNGSIDVYNLVFHELCSVRIEDDFNLKFCSSDEI